MTLTDKLVAAFVDLYRQRECAVKAPKRVKGRFAKRATAVGPTSMVDYVAIRTGKSHKVAETLVQRVGA